MRGRLRPGIRAYNPGGAIRVQLAVINDKSNVMLEYREASELFRYDYETGVLYRRRRVNSRVPETPEAGTRRKSNSDGYLNVSVNGRLYPVRRVVMPMCYGFYGEGPEADRINHVRNDNGLFNLRFVTGSENRKNQSVSGKNTSGVNGVYFPKAKKKYIARIKVNRETIYLGIFDTPEGAAEAGRQADRKYKFNNNHGEGRAEYVGKKADARLSKQGRSPYHR